MILNPKKLLRSFGYALDGIKLAIQLDQNVRFHLIAGILALILSFIFNISRSEFLIVLFAIFFVVICEMLNTAIEEMTNLIKVEHSREAMIAKDVAAGAVLLSAIFASVVGLVIFLPYVIRLGTSY